jgi:serine/threonine protein kinase
VTAQEECALVKRPTPEQSVYRVGVMAIRGIETALDEFSPTFSNYLTLTVGNRFDPPIEFVTVPVAFNGIVDELSTHDFVYANPSVFSCIESEVGANSLVSQVARRRVSGEDFSLTQFGGVIFTKADNDQVNNIEDIKGKRVATVSITGLGSGQMQFRELQRAGLHHLQSPEQLLFTGNQGKVVQSVLNGQVDVGFVRTDQLERSLDLSTGMLLDLSKIKIIGPRKGLISNGEPFPFQSSTSLYPEWNLASLPHVSDDVAIEVQSSLLAMAEHAAIAPDLLSCLESRNCSSPSSDTECFDECFTGLDQTLFKRCDTTGTLALQAYDALSSGRYTGWRSTLSYMELRNMQEEIRFINREEETGAPRCVRSVEIADAVVCPPQHFKKSDEEINAGCGSAGIDCYGYQCLCSPCVKGYDVDFFVVTDLTSNRLITGCDKFAVCGVVEQASVITFRAIDNKARNDAVFIANVIVGDDSESYEMKSVTNTSLVTHEFTFDATSRLAGVVIIQVSADGKQIDESPFRLEIVKRDCDAETKGANYVADDIGRCVCDDNTVHFGGKCVPLAVLLPSILLPAAALATVLVYLYIKRKRKQADSVWQIKPEELVFQAPPQVLGQGTFGVVVLAEYRGTQVAVKRVLPPKEQVTRSRNRSRGEKAVQQEVSCQKPVASVTGHTKDERLARRRQMKKSASDDVSLMSWRYSKPFDESNFTVPEDKVSELPQDKGSDEDLETGMRSNATSSPILGKDKSLADNHGVSEKGTGAAAAMSFSRAPHLQERLHKYIGKGVFPASEATVPSSDDSDYSDGKQLRPTVRKRSVTFSGEILSTNDSQEDSSNSLPDDFGYKTGNFDGTTFSIGAGKKSQSNSGARSSRRSYSWKRGRHTRMQSDFIEEMRYLSKLRHPCITTVMGAVISNKSEPMLVMEYMQLGSLYDLLHNESMVLEGELVLQILLDIAQGLRYLHTATPKVIHGDLKALNVLVDSKFHAKVADFGLSQKSQSLRSGTPLWMAPEVLRGETSNTSSSDIYSLGILMYEVFSRKDPYEGENHTEALRQIGDKKINKRPPVPPSCPPEAAELMTKCLQGEPADRPTARDVDKALKLLDGGSVVFTRHTRKSDLTMRTEDLLFQLFPKHVAEALRDGHKVAPESFDCVTVFFSDIVGFTDISSKYTSEQVANLLDRFFTKFDELAKLHKVFKVETIGDAYMTVTNLAVDQPDHARITAQFAFDAIEAASSTLIDEDDPSQGCVQIRVGFHSGPVVASICGSMSPRYTIIGDTVNTASRMESNSLPGRIHCSEASAKLMGENCPELKVVPRGSIRVKGKGEMLTYWIKHIDAPDAEPATEVKMSGISTRSLFRASTKSSQCPAVRRNSS